MFPHKIRPLWPLMLAIALSLSLVFLCGCSSGDDDDDDDDDFSYDGSITAPDIDPLEGLTDDAKDAVAIAPEWLRDELILNFLQMQDTQQDKAAELVLGYSDINHLDELVFMAAHISDGDWRSPGLSLDMLYENVESVYAADDQLDYVELTEHGTAEEGGDFYTTAEYSIETVKGVETVEIDRYYYYYYLVHPRLEDEGPQYIDLGEGAPVFWRDYLLNHADELCPGDIPNGDDGKEQFEDPEKTDWVECSILAERMDGIDVVWKGHSELDDNGAIGEICQWVNEAMWFWSYASRPIQPVKIYSGHVGRCGEHADLTSAATRAALIPAANIASYANDHTWNEFNDGEWVQYEPVNGYINEPDHYDNWSGGTKGAYRARGDGFAGNATSLYTTTGTILATVVDEDDNPVDGAVVVASGTRYGRQMPHTMAITDQTGLAAFEVGDDNFVHLAVNSPLGNTQPEQLPEKKIKAGETYEVTIELEDSIPTLNNRDPEDYQGAGAVGLRIKFENAKRYVNNMGIVASLGFTEAFDDVILPLYAVDAVNYGRYADDENFYAHPIELDQDGQVVFDMPHGGDWALFVSNYGGQSTTIIGQLTVELVNLSNNEVIDTATIDLYLFPGDMVMFELLGL